MGATIEHLKAVADANAVIGTPIQAEGVTLIPVSRLSVGVASGGTEFSTKKQAAGESSFGGGGGASAKLEPVAFLVIREGTTRVLPVAMPPMTTLDRVVEMMPDLVDKVEKYFDKKEEKEPV